MTFICNTGGSSSPATQTMTFVWTGQHHCSDGHPTVTGNPPSSLRVVTPLLRVVLLLLRVVLPQAQSI